MKGSTRSKVGGGRKGGPGYRTPSRFRGSSRFDRGQSNYSRKPFAKDGEASSEKFSQTTDQYVSNKPSYAPKSSYTPKPRYIQKLKKAQESVSTEPTYPMRLNRYLAIKNYSSRREADKLIEKGLVKINGNIAKIGDKINEKDEVLVDGKLKQAWKKYRYFLYYKPAKIVTHTSQLGQKSIKDVSGLPADVFPVGRLDRASQGLILMTNDGRVTDKLLNPEYNHEKEYVVRVNKKINTFFIRWMSEGIQLEDFKTKPCIVTKVDDDVFKIILTEGKKHQIRRMCTALGYEVRDLKRIRIMGQRIGLLKPGQYKELRGKTLTEFLISLGIG